VTGLLQRVENSIQNRRLLKRGRKILVAVSGGLDSMVLLHALEKASARQKWKLAIAHFNHQLRGRAGDADEKLVRKTAAAMKLPFVAGRANVKAFVQKSKLSIEMAARKLRHEFLARVARERKIQTVVLAHHADDQVELFFLRLLRGAGGRGLAGMKWRSPSPADPKIMLVRPLLDFSKKELSEFARENKIRFRDDATNFSSDFLRNRIRNKLLPLLRRNYQPGLDKIILRLMEITGAESEFAGEAARRWLCGSGRESAHPKKNQSRPAPASTVPKNDFQKLPEAIQRRVLQSQLMELGVAADFELIESLRQSADRFVSVGANISVSRNAEGTVISRAGRISKFNDSQSPLKLGRAGEIIFAGKKFRWQIQSRKKLPLHQNNFAGGTPAPREFFDADKIGNQIVLRHWRAGDRFQAIGLKSAVKLQDLFTNAKISRERRHDLILAATVRGEIFWVEGLRISEHFKLTPQTKRRLVWRWRKAD
jgi:tRNA(Ile)-lysidine synthase